MTRSKERKLLESLNLLGHSNKGMFPQAPMLLQPPMRPASNQDQIINSLYTMSYRQKKKLLRRLTQRLNMMGLQNHTQYATNRDQFEDAGLEEASIDNSLNSFLAKTFKRRRRPVAQYSFQAPNRTYTWREDAFWPVSNKIIGQTHLKHVWPTIPPQFQPLHKYITDHGENGTISMILEDVDWSSYHAFIKGFPKFREHYNSFLGWLQAHRVSEEDVVCGMVNSFSLQLDTELKIQKFANMFHFVGMRIEEYTYDKIHDMLASVFLTA
jgi:hypothetical protein